MMGSPADEAQRGNSESQHEVRLSYGYWLADTACTQEFWLAVWPVNPATSTPADRIRSKTSAGTMRKASSAS